MKVDFVNDLDGRLTACAQRAKLIAKTLQAFGTSDHDAPDGEALYALGMVAEELADELEAIRNVSAGGVR